MLLLILLLLLLLLLWQLLRPPATVIDDGRGRAEGVSPRKGRFLGTNPSHFCVIEDQVLYLLSRERCGRLMIRACAQFILLD